MSTQDTAELSADETIAQRIKDRMGQRRLSMRALSDATIIPYRTLQSYLSAVHTIPSPAMGRIADALGVSTDWLISQLPARLDRHSLSIAIANLDVLRSGAINAGHEMSLLSASQVLEDLYTAEYRATYSKEKPG